MIQLYLPGNPIPKARARTVRRGSFVHTYDPQAQTKQSIKNELEAQIQAKNDGGLPLPIFGKDIAIEASFCFFMPYPKDINHWIESYHLKKPDLDNVCKFYLDCLTGLAFHDDTQIISINAYKIYSDNPRTEINLMEKNTKELHPSINKILLNFSKDDVQKLHALTSYLHQKTASFNFDCDAEEWATSSAQIIKEIADRFSQKLAKIKRIPDIPKTGG